MTSPSIKQAYSLLAERCNVMLHSKFIMSSNCIAGILKVIASVPCLTNYLIKCSQDFSFDAAYNQATKTSTFKLPENSKATVAFVTELLYKFDRKEIDLTKFIKIFYPEKNFEGSYNTFCQEIIAPYLLSYSQIINEEDTQDAQQDTSSTIFEAARTQVTQYILALTEKVANDDSLKEEKRQDYLTMLNGLYYALEKDNGKMIKVVWLGTKSVMISYKQGVSYIQAIEKILQSYAVI